MSYADKQTDKALNGLIGQITTVYDDALSEVSKTASDYFASYRERFEKEKKAYEDGKYTQAEFYNWQVSQLGRGERWLKVRDDIAQRLTDANKVAAAYVNDTTPGIYALNANYSAYEIEQETGVAFDIYDEQTVKGLLTGQTKIIPSSRVKDADSNAWNEKKLTNALTSAILQGKDIGQIADAFQSVADMNRNAAIRNARTSITTAENAGRQASYEQAHNLGIEIKKEWIATEDDRTRDSHAELDGVQVPYDKPYPNGLMYPGDQNGEPSEFYNCRCTERAIIPKYNGQQRTSEIDGHKGDHTEETYKEWLDRKREEKMRNSKPTTHADATARAMEEKEEQQWNAIDNTTNEPTPITNNFTPAKNIAEAEEFAKQYVDENQFGALGVNYKGIKVEVANEINKAVSNVFDNFNIPKLGGVYTPTLNSKNGKAIQGATAAYSPIRNTILINKTTMSDLNTALQHFMTEENAVQGYLAHPENYDLSKASRRVANVLSNSVESGRGNVPDNIEEAIYHELGHYFEKEVKASDKYDAIYDVWEEYSPKISGYATDSRGEYIAESFCAYMKGEDIEPTLKGLFDGLRK